MTRLTLSPTTPATKHDGDDMKHDGDETPAGEREALDHVSHDHRDEAATHEQPDDHGH